MRPHLRSIVSDPDQNASKMVRSSEAPLYKGNEFESYIYLWNLDSKQENYCIEMNEWIYYTYTVWLEAAETSGKTSITTVAARCSCGCLVYITKTGHGLLHLRFTLALIIQEDHVLNRANYFAGLGWNSSIYSRYNSRMRNQTSVLPLANAEGSKPFRRCKLRWDVQRPL